MTTSEMTQADFIDLLRRTTDEDGWLQPILDHPDSRIVLEAVIAEFVRLSQAGSRAYDTGLISRAPTGTVGFTTVSVSKTGGLFGVLPAGTRFVDARGYVFLLLSDVTIPPGVFATGLAVVSAKQTEAVNTVDDPGLFFSDTFLVADATNAAPIVVTTTTPHNYLTGQRVRTTNIEGNTAANGLFTITVLDSQRFELDGSVGTGDFAGISGRVQPAPFDLVIDSATPVEGGRSNYLGVLADEKDMHRLPGEAPGLFRQRVLNIPDAVSPYAVAEAILGAALSLGLPSVLTLEPFDLGETQALKDAKALGSFEVVYCDGEFYCDDPFSEIVSLREARAYFRVEAPQPLSQVQFGAFFDGPGVVSFFDAFGFFDASDFTITNTALMVIAAEAERLRAAGVQYDVLWDVYDVLIGSGTIAVFALTLAFTLTPPAGKIWEVMEFYTGLSAPLPPGGGLSYRQFIRFTFEDLTTFDTPTQTMPTAPGADKVAGIDPFPFSRLAALGFPYGKRITKIEGFAGSDTISPVLQVAHFYIVEMTL